MEDTETPQMRKYGESKVTQIMMATVSHVTSRLGLWKFQTDGFLFNWVYSVGFQPACVRCKLTYIIMVGSFCFMYKTHIADLLVNVSL